MCGSSSSCCQDLEKFQEMMGSQHAVNVGGEGSNTMGNEKGYGQVICSPRYLVPMTRRCSSLKRGQDVEVDCSPKAEHYSFAEDGGGCACEACILPNETLFIKNLGTIRQNMLSAKSLFKSLAAIFSSAMGRKSTRKWAFCFCGTLIVFFILMKMSTIGWISAHIDQQTRSEVTHLLAYPRPGIVSLVLWTVRACRLSHLKSLA